MMRLVAVAGVALLAVLAAGGTAAGAGAVADAANATVSGTVTWANGTPVAEATVEAVPVGTGLGPDGVGATSTTDAAGSYELSVPAGQYAVVAAAGSESSDSHTVDLSGSDRLSLDLRVTPPGGPAPSEANVTARVRRTVTDIGAGDAVELPFSADEEAAVGVRSLTVIATAGINKTNVSVAAVEGGSVAAPPGRSVRLLYVAADHPEAIATLAPVLSLPGGTDYESYAYRGGTWRTADSRRVAATGDTLLLEATMRRPGYLAVAAPRTTATPATTWPTTTTPEGRDRLAGRGLRTAVGVVALVAAVALAVRGGHE